MATLREFIQGLPPDQQQQFLQMWSEARGRKEFDDKYGQNLGPVMRAAAGGPEAVANAAWGVATLPVAVTNAIGATDVPIRPLFAPHVGLIGDAPWRSGTAYNLGNFAGFVASFAGGGPVAEARGPLQTLLALNPVGKAARAGSAVAQKALAVSQVPRVMSRIPGGDAVSTIAARAAGGAGSLAAGEFVATPGSLQERMERAVHAAPAGAVFGALHATRGIKDAQGKLITNTADIQANLQGRSTQQALNEGLIQGQEGLGRYMLRAGARGAAAGVALPGSSPVEITGNPRIDAPLFHSIFFAGMGAAHGRQMHGDPEVAKRFDAAREQYERGLRRLDKPTTETVTEPEKPVYAYLESDRYMTETLGLTPEQVGELRGQVGIGRVRVMGKETVEDPITGQESTNRVFVQGENGDIFPVDARALSVYSGGGGKLNPQRRLFDNGMDQYGGPLLPELRAVEAEPVAVPGQKSLAFEGPQGDLFGGPGGRPRRPEPTDPNDPVQVNQWLSEFNSAAEAKDAGAERFLEEGWIIEDTPFGPSPVAQPGARPRQYKMFDSLGRPTARASQGNSARRGRKLEQAGLDPVYAGREELAKDIWEALQRTNPEAASHTGDWALGLGTALGAIRDGRSTMSERAQDMLKRNITSVVRSAMDAIPETILPGGVDGTSVKVVESHPGDRAYAAIDVASKSIELYNEWFTLPPRERASVIMHELVHARTMHTASEIGRNATPTILSQMLDRMGWSSFAAKVGFGERLRDVDVRDATRRALEQAFPEQDVTILARQWYDSAREQGEGTAGPLYSFGYHRGSDMSLISYRLNELGGKTSPTEPGDIVPLKDAVAKLEAEQQQAREQGQPVPDSTTVNLGGLERKVGDGDVALWRTRQLDHWRTRIYNEQVGPSGMLYHEQGVVNHAGQKSHWVPVAMVQGTTAFGHANAYAGLISAQIAPGWLHYMRGGHGIEPVNGRFYGHTNVTEYIAELSAEAGRHGDPGIMEARYPGFNQLVKSYMGGWDNIRVQHEYNQTWFDRAPLFQEAGVGAPMRSTLGEGQVRIEVAPRTSFRDAAGTLRSEAGPTDLKANLLARINDRMWRSEAITEAEASWLADALKAKRQGQELPEIPADLAHEATAAPLEQAPISAPPKGGTRILRKTTPGEAVGRGAEMGTPVVERSEGKIVVPRNAAEISVGMWYKDPKRDRFFRVAKRAGAPDKRTGQLMFEVEPYDAQGKRIGKERLNATENVFFGRGDTLVHLRKPPFFGPGERPAAPEGRQLRPRPRRLTPAPRTPSAAREAVIRAMKGEDVDIRRATLSTMGSYLSAIEQGAKPITSMDKLPAGAVDLVRSFILNAKRRTNKPIPLADLIPGAMDMLNQRYRVERPGGEAGIIDVPRFAIMPNVVADVVSSVAETMVRQAPKGPVPQAKVAAPKGRAKGQKIVPRKEAKAKVQALKAVEPPPTPPSGVADTRTTPEKAVRTARRQSIAEREVQAILEEWYKPNSKWKAMAREFVGKGRQADPQDPAILKVEEAVFDGLREYMALEGAALENAPPIELYLRELIKEAAKQVRAAEEPVVVSADTGGKEGKPLTLDKAAVTATELARQTPEEATKPVVNKVKATKYESVSQNYTVQQIDSLRAARLKELLEKGVDNFQRLTANWKKWQRTAVLMRYGPLFGDPLPVFPPRVTANGKARPWSIKEIADRTGVSERAVRRLLNEDLPLGRVGKPSPTDPTRHGRGRRTVDLEGEKLKAIQGPRGQMELPGINRMDLFREESWVRQAFDKGLSNEEFFGQENVYAPDTYYRDPVTGDVFKPGESQVSMSNKVKARADMERAKGVVHIDQLHENPVPETKVQARVAKSLGEDVKDGVTKAIEAHSKGTTPELEQAKAELKAKELEQAAEELGEPIAALAARAKSKLRRKGMALEEFQTLTPDEQIQHVSARLNSAGNERHYKRALNKYAKFFAQTGTAMPIFTKVAKAKKGKQGRTDVLRSVLPALHVEVAYDATTPGTIPHFRITHADTGKVYRARDLGTVALLMDLRAKQIQEAPDLTPPGGEGLRIDLGGGGGPRDPGPPERGLHDASYSGGNPPQSNKIDLSATRWLDQNVRNVVDWARSLAQRIGDPQFGTTVMKLVDEHAIMANARDEVLKRLGAERRKRGISRERGEAMGQTMAVIDENVTKILTLTDGNVEAARRWVEANAQRVYEETGLTRTEGEFLNWVRTELLDGLHQEFGVANYRPGYFPFVRSRAARAGRQIEDPVTLVEKKLDFFADFERGSGMEDVVRNTNLWDVLERYVSQGYRFKHFGDRPGAAEPGLLAQLDQLIERFTPETERGNPTATPYHAATPLLHLKRAILGWVDPARAKALEAKDARVAKRLASINRWAETWVDKADDPARKLVGKALRSYAQRLGGQLEAKDSMVWADYFLSLNRARTFGFHVMRSIRHLTQSGFTVAPRVGLDFYNSAMKELMTSGEARARTMAEARAAGAITEALPDMYRGSPRGETILGSFTRLAEKTTGIYTNLDRWERSLAYLAQKKRTTWAIEKFKQHGNPEQFVQESRLNLLHPVTVEAVMQHVRRGNWADAVRVHATALVKHSIFDYSRTNAPAWSRGVWGRMFGQYGRWPLNMLENMYGMVKYGTPEQKAEVLTTYAGVAAAVYGLGQLFGVETGGWIPFVHSFAYSGGPSLSILQDAYGIVSGDERVTNRYMKDFAKDPVHSILGQGFRHIMPVGDAIEALASELNMDRRTRRIYGLQRQSYDNHEFVARALGFRPTSDPSRHHGLASIVENLPPIPTVREAIRGASGVSPLSARAKHLREGLTEPREFVPSSLVTRPPGTTGR